MQDLFFNYLNMKEKIISLWIGVLLWVWLCFWYNTFFQTNTTAWNVPWSPGWKNMEMTDERLTQMAERLGMTKDELQKEIDAGKDIRTLMQEKWISPSWWRWTSSWSTQN